MSDVQRHLSTSLKSHGIINGMVRGSTVVGSTLVVQWSRSIDRTDKNAPVEKLTVCFQNNASAVSAANILERGMPEIVSEKKPTRRDDTPGLRTNRNDFTAL